MWYYTHLKTHRHKTFEYKLCSHISKLSGPSWSWSFGIWIYNYPCNLCLSPLMLWVRILLRERCTTLCDKVCQWLAAGRCFFPGTSISSNDNADRNDITEILLKVALNTIKPIKANILGQNFAMRVSQSCMKMYSDANYFWDKSMLWPNNDDLILAGYHVQHKCHTSRNREIINLYEKETAVIKLNLMKTNPVLWYRYSLHNTI